MKVINKKDEVLEIIKNNEMTIIYFSGTSCGACEVIKEKVEKIVTQYPAIETAEINAVVNSKIAAEYNIFSLPILLLFVDGKETIRLGRNFDGISFANTIDRYYKMIFN
ncbi:MAG: thioredoxin family protein [Clostridium sp.]